MKPFRPPSGPLIQNAREYAGLPAAEMTLMSQFVMSPCEKKCDADYEADAIVCSKVADEAERKNAMKGRTRATRAAGKTASGKTTATAWNAAKNCAISS